MTSVRFAAFVTTMALAAPAARAADPSSQPPLVVVVEAPAGLGVDGAKVRRLIGAELGRAALAPGEAGADAVSTQVIVSLDDDDLRLSLREVTGAPLSRTVPTPTTRAGRLQAIAWLAGNLARDQIGPIVTQPPNPTSTPDPAPTPAPEPLPTTPAAWSPPAPASAAPVEELTAAADRTSEPPTKRWAITLAAGPTTTGAHILGVDRGGSGQTPYSATYQLELAHDRGAPGGFVWGLALELSPMGTAESVQHATGAAGFFGARADRRWWFAEATVGAGLEAVRVRVQERTITTDASGTADSTTVSSELLPGPYLRGVAGLGVRVTGSLDLMARVALHVGEDSFSDFLAATLAVRVRLP